MASREKAMFQAISASQTLCAIGNGRPRGLAFSIHHWRTLEKALLQAIFDNLASGVIDSEHFSSVAHGMIDIEHPRDWLCSLPVSNCSC
jgi:hypothetical protein